MNVLSLFDGISCGRVALKRANIAVTKYYASEIDKYAIKISQSNWSDIIQLGDVQNWREWDIDWKSIDLLLAGFPCQSWSVAGRQLGDKDPRGALMWTMLDILDHIKSVNPDIKFLFENVRMKKEHLDYVNRAIGVESINIDSNIITEANRNRYYWLNFYIDDIEPVEKNPEDILPLGWVAATVGTSKNRVLKRTKKFGALTATMYKGITAAGRPIICHISQIGKHLSDADKFLYRMLSPSECEHLQTLPDGYTQGVSKTQRYRAIGNGWTIDIITHILKGLQ